MTKNILLATVLAFMTFPVQAALADPPGRVGGLSYLEGTVSMHGPGAPDDQWDYAALNQPVTTGDAFWTEPNARSEIQVGPATIRMDHATEMNVTELDDNTIQLDVPQGAVSVHVAAPIPGGITVTTPSGVVSLTQPGTYDINSGIDQDNGTAQPEQIAALEGQATITVNGSQIVLQPGESMMANGATFSLAEAAPTDFDDWALARDQAEIAPAAGQYVSPDVTGYQDLDQYGQWSQDPNYGDVWYPQQVQADWAPYRYGHWADVEPWGWTWIDDAPWGFAPFHYGRWVQRDGRWGWWPGERQQGRAVYAPALVAFVGGGPSVGWVPLAPHEAYRPYYAVSVDYERRVNARYDAHGGGDNFANRNAATVVPAQNFGHGRHVEKHMIAANAAALTPASAAPPRVAAGHAHGSRSAQSAPGPGSQGVDERERGGLHHAAPTAVQPAIDTEAATRSMAAPPAVRDHNIQGGEPVLSAPHDTVAASTVSPDSGGAPHPHRHGASANVASFTSATPHAAFTAPPRSAADDRPAERQVHMPAQPAQVQHPVQHAHLAATNHGWKRQAAPAKPAAAPRKPDDKH